MEDELARDLGPVEGFYSDNISLVPFHDATPGPALVSALIPALVPTPATTLLFFNELFKQFMKAYLELNQRFRQPLAEREQFFKAKVPDIYYKKWHIDCYHFC